MSRTGAALAAAVFSVVFPSARADDAALRDAAASLQRGDSAGAEAKLRSALTTQPNDADALSMLGMVLDGRGNFPEADALYRKALAASPRSVAVLGRYANHLLAAGDEAGAHDAFGHVVAIDPAEPYANLALARLALKNDDAAHAREALRYLDKLPSPLRDSAEVAVPRLIALDRTADARSAEVLSRLSDATQNDPKLSSSIGRTLARSRQFAQAETFLTHALAGNPSDFQTLYDLGVVALYAQHYERAREVLERAVHEQPANADALYSLAFVYNSLKQPEPSLRSLAEAAKAAPLRADVQRLIAVITGELQANEDSAAAWDRYAALAPQDDTARRERGFARIHMRQFETGLADLEWYIARHPEDPVGYYELGLAQSMNDPTKGLAGLDKALGLKPDFVEARSARGALLYLQGKPESAVPDLEAAAKGQSSNGLILDRLGQAYGALDRLDDSIRALRKASELSPGEPTIVLHLANALAEAGKDLESESLIGRYRQMRPTQAPRDLMKYLSLSPEQQRADYRARVEKAVQDNPADANAQLHSLKLALEERQTERALATARVIGSMKGNPAILADAGRALLAAGEFSNARDLLEKAAAGPSAGLGLPLAIAAFHSTGASEGLRRMKLVPEAERTPDYFLALGQMLDASGSTEEALSALDRAIEASPERIDLLWQKMVLLNKAGRLRDAESLLDRAEDWLHQQPWTPVLRAALWESNGQTDRARQVLEAARRQWPEVAAVWVAKGMIAAAHGSEDRGLRALETAVALGAHSPEVTACLEQIRKGPAANPAGLFFTRPPQDW